MVTNSSEPVLIVGTGAMACLFAAKLSAAGYRVRMLGYWPEGLAALNNLGVTLVNEDGSLRSYPVTASANPKDFAGIRLAIVLVKSWQTEHAAELLFDCLAMDGVALTLQNGLGNREQLVQRLGAERVAVGVIRAGATLLGPGQIRSGGDGIISLAKHVRLEALAKVLTSSGFKVEVSENLDSLAWGKLAINAAMNPVTALLRIENGELLTRPKARELWVSLANEVAEVAQKKNIRLPFDSIQAIEDVSKATAANKTSMLQDVLRDAPTEIEAINGAVVRAGREVGVPTPVNEVMWKLISSLQGDL